MAATAVRYGNFIDGAWADSAERVDDVNPATGELIGVFAESTTADADRAVEAATAAFERWRLVPAPKRAEILFRVAELIRDRKEDLSRLMTQEMGKVLAEARGDVQEGIDMTYFMAGEGRRQYGQTVPAEMPDKAAMSVRRPMGVVAAITPWNFPLAIPTWKIMPALVTGNTVVFKPASDTPLLAAKLMELFVDAGLPQGVVNMVYGSGATVGEHLVKHPDVPVVSFTGSLATGRRVNESGAPLLKRTHLELGGKNAIIVLADGDVDNAVDGIVWSAFGTSGQRCTAASRVIVDKRVHDQLLSKLVAQVEQLRLGDGLDPATDVGPVINSKAVDKIDGYANASRGVGPGEGARVLTGGEVARDGDLGRGHFYRPTVLADVEPGMRVAQEEIFGPVTSVIRCDGFDDAVRIANGIEYGLSSALYTADVNNAFRAMRDLDTGITYINAGTTGAEVHLPFGGVKATGNGHREAGTAALDTYTEWKSIYVDYSGTLQRAQIDNQ
jgi:alpha-ketoglutaric semialdehyde dehydrogenase